MVTFKCDNCGIESSTYPSHYKKMEFHFCSSRCSEAFKTGKARGNPSQLPKVTTVKCDSCGARFSRKNKDVSLHNFCSKQCFTVFNEKHRNIIMGKAERKEKVKIVCEHCGKEFMVYKSRGKQKFCSLKCKVLSLIRPEIHLNKTCVYCGKPYSTTIHQVQKRDRKYCSVKCANSGMRTREKAYSFYWRKIAAQIRKRDNNTCQLCYRHSKERNLDVHHKRPARLFGEDYESANQSENLITLCKSCHKKVEENPSLLARA